MIAKAVIYVLGSQDQLNMVHGVHVLSLVEEEQGVEKREHTTVMEAIVLLLIREVVILLVVRLQGQLNMVHGVHVLRLVVEEQEGEKREHTTVMEAIVLLPIREVVILIVVQQSQLVH